MFKNTLDLRFPKLQFHRKIVHMELYLNGEARQFESAINISTLTQLLGLEHQRIAIEVNRCIIPKSLHTSHILQEGDHVEVIQAIGGG